MDGGRLVHLELHRVDLVAADDPMDGAVLRESFEAMSSLLVLSVTDCRWPHSVALPPQIKFLRFTPSDLSVLDLSRIADRHRGDVNWPCDLIVDHLHWPSVMNQHIVAGHEALQNKKLRIWVLRTHSKWDGVLMNVNYSMLPPPLHLFRKAKCFQTLRRIDRDRDMSSFWTSKRADFWRDEPL